MSKHFLRSSVWNSFEKHGVTVVLDLDHDEGRIVMRVFKTDSALLADPARTQTYDPANDGSERVELDELQRSYIKAWVNDIGI